MSRRGGAPPSPKNLRWGSISCLVVVVVVDIDQGEKHDLLSSFLVSFL